MFFNAISKRVDIFLTFFTLLFSQALYLGLNAQTAKKKIDLSYKHVLERIEKESTQLQLAKIEKDFLYNSVLGLQGAYDSKLNANVGYRIDASDPVNAVFGTRNDTFSYSLNMQKQLSTGTQVEVGVMGSSQSSNSPFVNLDPAIDNKVYARFIQPLWNNALGKNIKNEIEALNIQSSASELTVYRKKEIIVSTILLQTIQLEAAQTENNILNKAVKRAQDLYIDSKSRYRQGLANKSDVYASESNVLRSQQQLAMSEQKQEQVCLNLLRNLSYDLSQYSCPQVNIGRDIIWANQAQQFVERKDLQRLEKDVLANKILLKAKQRQLSPDLNLILDLAFNGVNDEWSQSFKDGANLSNPNAFVGVEFSFPLGQKAKESEFLRNKIQAKQLRLQIQTLKEDIEKEYQDALQNMNYFKKQLALAKKQTLVEQQKLKQKNNDYRIGRSEVAEVILYQQDILSSQLNEDAYLQQQRLAQLNLYLAQGTVLKHMQKSSGVKK